MNIEQSQKANAPYCRLPGFMGSNALSVIAACNNPRADDAYHPSGMNRVRRPARLPYAMSQVSNA